MNERLQPAFWGGLFIGVLSALPFISAGNCCCCLWVICGGVLASYLRQQNSPYQITAAEGALVGLMAGLIGGVIGAVLSIPMNMMTEPMVRNFMDRVLSANPDIPPEARDALRSYGGGGGRMIVGAIFMIVSGVVFGLLGGLLGVAIFKKNLPPPPPPPGTVEVLPPQ